MIGDKYIIETATSTRNEILLGMLAYFYDRLKARESEQVAAKLATSTSMYLFGEQPEGDENVRFRRLNESRIRKEAQSVSPDHNLCELLSGAAYNIGYGRYVASGGGRLMNRYLGYMRMETAISNPPDAEQFHKMENELEARHPGCLCAVLSLKKLGIWRSRPNNPNELEYYRAVHTFAEKVGAFR